MDSDYAHFGRSGDKIPWFTGIVLKDVRIDGAGKLTLQGYDAQHRLGMIFDNVHLDSPEKIKVAAEQADLVYGPGPVNLKVTGPDVKVTGSPSAGKPNACTGKFVAIPVR
jgi:polygalacturonase